MAPGACGSPWNVTMDVCLLFLVEEYSSSFTEPGVLATEEVDGNDSACRGKNPLQISREGLVWGKYDTL